jgi:predicted XRE-type DNA-binding protein
MTTKTKRSKAADRLKIEPGSGNVFMDLGLPHPEERLAKAELARVIHALVSEKGWTQRRAAQALGIAPSDMSDLMRGNRMRQEQARHVRVAFLRAQKRLGRGGVTAGRQGDELSSFRWRTFATSVPMGGASADSLSATGTDLIVNRAHGAEVRRLTL